jgi:hypothetical protein
VSSDFQDEEALAVDGHVQGPVAGDQIALLVDALVVLDPDSTQVGLLPEALAEQRRESGLVGLVAAGVDVGQVATDGVERVALAHHGKGAGHKGPINGHGNLLGLILIF